MSWEKQVNFVFVILNITVQLLIRLVQPATILVEFVKVQDQTNVDTAMHLLKEL